VATHAVFEHTVKLIQGLHPLCNVYH
jgi:hypothetical protein